MPNLTDIRTPNPHFRGGHKPQQKPKFLKRLLKIIFAPIILPYKLIVFLLRSVARGITGIARGIKNLFQLFSLIGLGAKTAFTVIKTAIKAVLTGFWNFLPNNWVGWLVLLIGVGLLLQLAITTNILPFLTFPSIDQNKWQAVFINNGQIVYFGHLKNLSGDYVALADVYYLRAPADGKNPPTLVKLGDELYGPENKIFIPKGQITFWENLREDSQVAQAIRKIESGTQ